MTDRKSAPDIGIGQLAALIMLGNAGVGTFLALPVIAAALVSVMGYTQSQVGTFSTIQLVSVSVGCGISLLLPRGLVRRHGAIAIAIMLLCDLASIFTLNWNFFLIFRATAGCAGGVAVAQAMATMALTRNAERSFGLFIAIQTIIAIACVYAFPVLVADFGFGAAYALLLGLDVIALVLIVSLLHDAKASDDFVRKVIGNDLSAWLRSVGLLSSILCFFVGVGAIWTFLAILGQGIGLDEPHIAAAITVSKLIAFIASFIPGILRTRLGRIAPIICAFIILFLALQTLMMGTGFKMFVIGTALFSFGWYILYPFLLAALAHVDRDGRPMMAGSALTGIGLGMGPAFAMAISSEGTRGIYAAAFAAFAASLVIAVMTLMWRQQQRAAI